MQISEVMSFGDYWSDRRFECKRPNWAGNEVQKAGDNIYRPLNSRGTARAFQQKSSYHSNRDRSSNSNTMKHDTKTDRVLISKRFWYWGGSGPDIPLAFLGISSNWPTIRALRNHRSQFPPEMLDAFVDWVHSFGRCGILGAPFDSIKNQACPAPPKACVKRTS